MVGGAGDRQTHGSARVRGEDEENRLREGKGKEHFIESRDSMVKCYKEVTKSKD